MSYFIYILVFFIHGQSIDGLLESYDLRNLRLQQEKLEDHRRNRVGCKEEKQKKWFPYHCILSLQSELEKPSQTRNLQIEFSQLEKACIKSYRELQRPDRIDRLLRMLLPRGCQDVLTRHRADLLYVSGSDPGFLFHKNGIAL